MAEFLGGCNGEEVDTCGGVSEMKNKFVGVSKSGNRWQARVRDPKLRADVYLGSYRTPEEAAIVVKKKRLEFEEMYKGVSMDIRRGYFNGVKLPVGVRPDNGRWRVQLWHPKLKHHLQLGSYKTCEEAAIVAEMKRAEFQDLQEPTCEGVGIVADEKRADFGESNKPVTDVARKSSDQTAVVKMPPGVRRIPSGKWIARIRDPVAKTQIWLGTFNTVDEARRAYNEKKVSFATAKMTRVHFDGSEFENMDKPHSKPDETSVKLERELEYNSPASSLVHTSDVQVPRGVRRVSSGKWVARIRDPVAKTQLWLGTFNTVDEARRAYNEKKVSFATAKMTRAPCDGSEFENLDKPRSKVDEVSVKLERELEYNSPASSLVTDCLNVVAHDVQSNHGHGKVHSYPTSIYYAGNSNSASVSDKTHALVFNRKVNLNIVNEYGQLLGEFEELDEQMWLNLPD